MYDTVVAKSLTKKQTVEYMDAARCKVGLVSNYDAYIVILRLAVDKVALSSPVIRQTSLRTTLPEPLANGMSVYDLLLSLLLFTANPSRLTGEVWLKLYVRERIDDRLTHRPKLKRKGNGSGSAGNKKSRADDNGGSGSGSGRRAAEESGESQGDSQLSGGGRAELTRSRARTSHTLVPSLNSSSSTQSSDQVVETPDVGPGSSSPLFGPLVERSSLHLLLDPKQAPHTHHPDPEMYLDCDAVETPLYLVHVDFLRPIVWRPIVTPSTLGRIMIQRLIAQGEHFTTFSATSTSSSSSSYDSTFPSSHASTTSPSRSHDSQMIPETELIVKLARLYDRPHHKELGLPSGSDVARAVETERRILSGPLRHLQGSSVPRLEGVWRSASGEWELVVLGKVAGRQMGQEDMLEEGEL